MILVSVLETGLPGIAVPPWETMHLEKCHSLLLVSTVYIGHWLFHVLYMLYQLFHGFILQSDVDRINAMFRKAKRWGIVTDELDLDHLSTLADSGLFHKIKYENHCLHHLLPKVREVVSYSLRGRPTRYEPHRTNYCKLLNSFIYRCAKLNYWLHKFSIAFIYYSNNELP